MTKLTAITNQVEEEEPPGITTTRNDVLAEEEEPPGNTAVTDGTAVINRKRFFSHISEENWNDWKWQFRNRITTVEELVTFFPLGENRDSVVSGLVHRYPDRLLMVLTDICPMLCRHCTRKREWHNGGWVH